MLDIEIHKKINNKITPKQKVMAKRFHHHIAGDFHIKNGIIYMLVKVFRPNPQSAQNKNPQKRVVLTRMFLGRYFCDFQCYLPSKWEAGVSYELQRVRYDPGIHTLLES